MKMTRVVVAATAIAAMAVAGCSSSAGAGGSSSSGAPASSGGASSSAPAASSGASSGSASASSGGSAGAGSSAPAASGTASGGAGSAGASCTLKDPVKIGVVFTMTGAGAQYGATQKNGVQLAVDQLNAKGGVTYDVDFQDSQTKPTQAISIFQKFIADGDSLIIGPTLSNAAQQTDPIAQKSNIPVIGVSNTAAGITAIGDYIFRDSLTEASVVPQTVKVATKKYNLKSVVLMYADDDAFSEADYTSFKAAFDAEGVTISKVLKFSTNDTDFRSLLTEAKAAKPDALVVGGLIDPAVSITQQARQLGMTMPIVGGNGFNSPVLMKDAGSAANGVVVGAAWNSASDNPLSQQFIKDYQAKYSSAPDQFATQAYTGMLIANDAVRTACSSDRGKIRDALATVKDLPTPLGPFSFTAGRDADAPAVVQIVQDGKFAVLK